MAHVQHQHHHSSPQVATTIRPGTSTNNNGHHMSTPFINTRNNLNAHPSFKAISSRFSRSHKRTDSSRVAFTQSHRFSTTSNLSHYSDSSTTNTLVPGELNQTSVSINLIKCAVGAGSFSLPAAFLHAGFWAGILLCCFLGLLAAVTVDMLSAAERHLSSAAGHRLRYPDIALLAFKDDWRGPMLRNACLFGVLATSLGVCAVYVIFISTQITNIVGSDTTTQMDVALMLSPIIVGLALLRSFKYLVFTSILGDVAVLLGLIGTIFIGVSNGIKASPFAPVVPMMANGTTALQHLPAINWSTLPESAGSIAFLFCIHVVILPISQSLKGDANDSVASHKKGFRCVTFSSYFCITLVNVFFGAACVCLFGLETQGNVLSNIAASGTYPSLVLTIRVLLCIDLLFTIPMVLAAGREIIEDTMVDLSCGRNHVGAVRNATRVMLVVVIYIIVATVPKFEEAVSLVGGFANSLMGLILPPLLMYYVVTPQGGWCRWSGSLLISLLGGVLLVSSTYFTVKSLV